MFGFVIGALSLIGLVKVLRAGRCGGGYGRRMGACGAGWGHHGGGWHQGGGWHGGGWHHGGGWGHGGWQGGGWQGGEGRGRNAFGLRFVFERLDTTPGQEKVIRQAFDEVREAMQTGQGELEATRREIAAAIRAGHVDETQMGELYARHDEKLRTLRTTFFGALAKVTEALDEDQRKTLADLIDRGQGAFFGGGPYRN
ncbi:MAG: Spy/CpxP family protein refolding chaperone [Sandaracinaceae bacterium]|nr:Spy/CpxP family protein refolding chaperone [Sandaracinaceae bacterium]